MSLRLQVWIKNVIHRQSRDWVSLDCGQFGHCSPVRDGLWQDYVCSRGWRFLSTITRWAASISCHFWDEYARSVHVRRPCFCWPPWSWSSVPTTSCFWTRCSWSFWDGHAPSRWPCIWAQHLPTSNGTSGIFTDDFYHKEDDPTSFEESQEFEFENKSIRRAFIWKVFLLLTAQLLVTDAFGAFFTFVQEAKSFVKLNTWTYSVSCLICFVSVFAISCCGGVCRRHAWNSVALWLLTHSMSYMDGMIASFHNNESVVMALGITAAVWFSSADQVRLNFL